MAANPARSSHYHVSLPSLHAKQALVYRDTARFIVVDAGRGWGKSTFGLEWALEPALNHPGWVSWYIGPSYPEVALQWRELQAMCPPGFPGVFRESDHRLVLWNGSEVAFKSAEVGERKLRGGQRNRVVIDEAASIPDGLDIWDKAVRPSLTRHRGQALFIGTPRGSNWFQAMYQRGLGGDRDWHSWKFTSYDSPYLPADDIDAARGELPDRVFRQEYLGEFIEDGSVFANVHACVGDVSDFGQPFEDRPARIVFGQDWGKLNDFTVTMGLDLDRSMLKRLYRASGTDYGLQRRRIKQLADEHHPAVIAAERNAMGEPNIEELEKEQLPVVGLTTGSSDSRKTQTYDKGRAVQDLALLLEKGLWTIEDDEVVVNEFGAFGITRTPAGRYTYGSPHGMHDDCVMASILANEGREYAGRYAHLEFLS